MDKLIDARFERVERALAVLIDSLANYNPSPALAEDLLAADAALAVGLRQIQDHQNNHLRLQRLRAEAAALDATIKETIETLASSRRELLQAPATVFPEDNTANPAVRAATRQYTFTYEQLMSYARRISRNTVPRQGQTDGAEFYAQLGFGPVDAAEGANNNGDSVPGTAPGTAAPTPAPTTPGLGATPGVGATPGPVSAASPVGLNGTSTLPSDGSQAVPPPPDSVPNVPEDIRRWVSPLEGSVFIPWPDPGVMQTGALRALHRLSEKAPDAPVEFVSLEEQEEEERQAAIREEAERVEREERHRRMAEAAAAAERARQSQQRPNGQAPPQQFASAFDE